MRSDKNKHGRRVKQNRYDSYSKSRYDYEDDRRAQGRSERNRKRRKTKKPLSEGKKRFIRKCNNIFIFLYIIFAIYRIISYFSWKSIVVPMMKNESTAVVDINGGVVEKIGGERAKLNVSKSDIPQDLIDAYVDIEDERFYSHKGVDIKRTTAAIGTYITHGGKSSFGGSTITQQLVKNITGNDDTSISRKVEEWIKALELESFASKDEILVAYLNIIYTAPNVYGVGMGARYYFDKDVQDLSLAECAYIAGINISPNSYNPFTESDNSQRIKNRTKTVLGKMLAKKHITQEEYDAAIEEVENGLAFSKGEVTTENDGVYSYYTDAVVSEVVEDISEKKHINKKLATNYLYMAGLTIHSAEDSSVQEKIENEYENKNYILTSSSGQKSQAAMVIIDHTTGQVRGVAGGLGEKTVSRGLNRATQSYRQTGSAIKPIAVLAPGIDNRTFTASTVYADEPTTFAGGYEPKDNDKCIGDITVRRAVESSQNIPFVKMMEQVTPKVSIKYMRKMGISSLTDRDETLALALGGEDKGITPLEMAGAYACIANDGVYIEPTFYKDVVDSNGKTVIKSKQKKKKVFSKEVAYILKDLLKQPVEGASGTAKVCKISGMDVAAKTGTTSENYDKWLCGFTPYYTAVTWYGYDQNESISYGGRSPAAQLWSAVMRKVHSNLEGASFSKPSGVKEAEVCSKNGKLANSKCSPTHTEYYLGGTLPDKCVECTGASYTNKNTTNNEPVSNNDEEDDDEQDDDTQVTNVPANSVQNKTETTPSSNTNSQNTVQNTSSSTSTNTVNNQNSTNNQNTTNNTGNKPTSNNNDDDTNNSNQSGLVDDGEQDTGP